MRPVAPALLVLLVVAAPAAACSLAEEPPAPGAFFIEDPATGESVRVDIEGRMLGAGCELSNPHALRGDLFAWFEIDVEMSGEPRDLHVLDLATRDVRVFEEVTTASVESTTITDGRLVYVTRDWSREAGPTQVFSVDLESGEHTALDVAVPERGRAFVEDDLLVVQTRGADDTQRVSVHYLAEGVQMMDERPIDALDVPADASVAMAGGGRWLLIHHDENAWAHDLLAARTHALDLPDRTWPLDIDGGALVLHDWENDMLLRKALPDGAPEPWVEATRDVGAVQEGRLVRLAYSAPGDDGLDPVRTLAVEGKDVPAAAPLALVALAGALALVRARRG